MDPTIPFTFGMILAVTAKIAYMLGRRSALEEVKQVFRTSTD
jgi:hypothetical protein